MRKPSALERALSKVAINMDTGCWEWVGAIDPNGYAAFKAEGKKVTAHRWIYQQVHGVLPAYLHIDHLCRNRRCVNPAHMEPVTQRENNARGDSPAALAGRNGVCCRGHNDWRLRPNGHRDCRECQRERERHRPPRKRPRRVSIPLPIA